jgi:AcrR family transcriptional regulator
MARPMPLTRDRIVEAAATIAEREGAEHVTVRAIGEELGCDPTALYRHFRNVDELHRAVGDRFLGAVDVTPRPREAWRAAVRRLCIELRQAQVGRPRLATFVHAAPTRLANELAITEAILRELRKGGFKPTAAARAYHSLVELTVGSAAIDAPLADLPTSVRNATYRRWRNDYSALDAAQFPATLDLMLSGLVALRR